MADKTKLEIELMAAVKAKLLGQGVKQSITAKQLGIHQSEISQILRGVAQTSLSKLIGIAEGLGIKVVYSFNECEAKPLPGLEVKAEEVMQFIDHGGIM